MKRLLLVSTISLLPASAHGMYRINKLSPLQQQLQYCNQNNNKKTDYELAQLVTGIQILESYKNTTVIFIPTITRPQHNHPAILGTKHLISINNADTIAAMSNGRITVTQLVKKQPTRRPSSAVLTTPLNQLPPKKRPIPARMVTRTSPNKLVKFT